MTSAIPPEIIYEIFYFLPQGPLSKVAGLSRQFNTIAVEPLYRHIVLRSVYQIFICCRTLVYNRSAAQKVRTFDIAIREPGIPSQTFYEFLRKGLISISGNLTHLWFDDRVRDIFGEIGVIRFPRLVYLFTTLRFTPGLVSWLFEGLNVESLEFYGHWNAADNPNDPSLHGHTTISPRLVKLTGPLQLMEYVVPRSNISNVEIISYWFEPIHPLLCSRVARALARTNTPITSLTILGPLVTESFFEDISNCLPSLRIFIVQMMEVSLMASPMIKEILYHWMSKILLKSPHLRVIELRSTPFFPMTWQHLQKEYEILLCWSEMANDLDTCLMPTGIWWGRLKDSPEKLINERKPEWIPAFATYELSVQAQRAWSRSKLWEIPELNHIMRRVEETGKERASNFLRGAWGASAWGPVTSTIDFTTLRSVL